MRDVVLYALVSLDGVAEEPGDWMSEADEDRFAKLAEVIRTQDDILLGRHTYDYWVDHWRHRHTWKQPARSEPPRRRPH